MKTHSERTQKSSGGILTQALSKSKNGTKGAFQFADNRPESMIQGKLHEISNKSSQVNQAAQMKFIANAYSGNTIQKQGAEEEELLQGKFETVQKVEEEELLQGKFGTVQKVDEEELLQGKFETVQKVEEEEELLQGKFETVQKVEDEELLQGKFGTVQKVEEEELLQGKFETVQKVENNTGLPDQLKSGVENLSGQSLDDVKVHYNSDKPSQLQAHAYAQGTDIHVAPGQEKHLPHEAWHVVQQKQGRVKPTMQMKGKVNVNDDAGLEKEADVMGAKALSLKKNTHDSIQKKNTKSNNVTQRAAIPGVNGFGNFVDLGNGLFGTTQVTNANEVAGLVNTIRQNTEHQNIKVLTGTHGTKDGHLVGEHKFYTEDMAHEGHKIQNGGWINVLDVVGKSKGTVEGWMQPGHSAIILAWCFSKMSVDNWANVHHATKSPKDGGKWIW